MNTQSWATTQLWTATSLVLLTACPGNVYPIGVTESGSTSETTAGSGTNSTTLTESTSSMTTVTETTATSETTTEVPTTDDTTSSTTDPPLCNNGVLDEGEECDNTDDKWCNDDCMILVGCGNGRLDEGESCDHGALNREDPLEDSAECDADCSIVECGDGHINMAAGEVCDPTEDESDLGCILPDTPGYNPMSGLDCKADTRIIFVTQARYSIGQATGDFYMRSDQPSSAGHHCSEEAGAETVGLGDPMDFESYRAWLSLDSNVEDANAIDHTRLTDHPVLVGVQHNGKMADEAGLENFVFAVWNENENNENSQYVVLQPFVQTVGGEFESQYVWTASDAAGQFYSDMSGTDCANWTENSDFNKVLVGRQTLIDQWTQAEVINCDGTRHFYCIEQL